MNRGQACLGPTWTCVGLGEMIKRRGAEKQGRSAHTVAGLVPGCPPCTDDGYPSGRGFVLQGVAPG